YHLKCFLDCVYCHKSNIYVVFSYQGSIGQYTHDTMTRIKLTIDYNVVFLVILCISTKLFDKFSVLKVNVSLFRLCSLSLVQIILDRPIEPECANTGFYVVVRMRGTARRVLRSPEITLICSKSPQAQVVSTNAHSNNLSTNPNEVGHSESTGQPCANTSLNASVPGGGGGGGSVLIDFTCNIQYSHLLTRDSNTLQILLQRRKKYKSKAMNLGYKTLAYCNVNLAQVSFVVFFRLNLCFYVGDIRHICILHF
ncbi:unnamed protein product, partial [Trichobilharzia regenti]